MKFTIEIEPELNPNAVGEYLRSAFFDEKEVSAHEAGTHGIDAHRLRGCYETFDWRKDVDPLEDIHIEEVICPGCRDIQITPARRQAGPVAWHGTEYTCTCVCEELWTRGRKRCGDPVRDGRGWHGEWVECRWYWDGDGTLAFIFPDGKCLVSTDCKNDYEWSMLDSVEDL